MPKRPILAILAAIAACSSPKEATNAASSPRDPDAEREGRLLRLCKGGVEDACKEIGVGHRASIDNARPEPDSIAAPVPKVEPRDIATEPVTAEPEVTREELETQCQAGTGAACFWIGIEVTLAAADEKGESGRHNLREVWEPAQPYFRRGCALGFEESCTAVLLDEGFYCTVADPPHHAVVTQPEEGHCDRSFRLCDGARKMLAENGWTASECILREQSACHSYLIVLERRTVRACYATFDDCELWRVPIAEKAKTSRDIANVTECKATK